MNYEFENKFSDNVNFINVNNNISSTLVRKQIKIKGNFEKFVLPEVASYINQNELYK